jgi:2-amino-4-hydroxy-6-hydroxymethyldihydropteridine diphosphokinase
MKSRVVIALGSNLGNRRQNLTIAVDRLGRLALGELLCSSFYETAPVAMMDAGDFINAAVTFETDLSPEGLLSALKVIEVDMGRPADHGRNTERVIDLDIILFGDRVINHPGLIIPHPRAHVRDFVLLPLLEIAPDSHRRLIAGRSKTGEGP